MKIYKKVISLLLAILMLSSSVAVFAESDTEDQAAPAYVMSDKLKENIAFLRTLNIIDDNFLTAENHNQAVTNEEFIASVFRLLNINFKGEETVKSDTSLSEKDNMSVFDDFTYGNETQAAPVKKYEPTIWFVDVPASNPNFDIISMAFGMGLISNNAEKRFYPEKSITFKEGLKILVSVLGYDVIAKSKGGYPAGYIQTALSLSLNKGIDIAKPAITREDLVQLFYNSLFADYVVPNAMDSFKIVKDQTILTERFKVEKASGIVNGNEYTNFYDFNQTSSGFVKIDKDTYKVGDTSANELLGYNIDFYYSTDEKDDNYHRLVYIIKNNKNGETIIPNEDFISYADRKISYRTENDGSKSATISSSATVVFQGRMVTDYSSIFNNLESGNIRLIDNNDDGSYEVALVSSYGTIVVDSIDSIEHVVYNKLKYKVDIDFNLDSSASEKVIIKDINGKSLEFSSIKMNSVLFYCKSIDDYLTTVIVSTTPEKSGVIKEIMGSENKLLIDDGVYKVSNAFLNGGSIGAVVQLEKTYRFMLDPEGEIAYVLSGNETADPKNAYAYLVDAGKTSAINQGLEIKLFTQFNEMIIVKSKTELMVNKVSHSNMDDVLNILKTSSKLTKDAAVGTKVVRQLVKYKLDDNNMLTELDFPYDGTAAVLKTEANESADSLHYIYKALSDTTTLKARPSNNTFQGLVAFDSKAIVFSVPVESVRDEDDQYYAGTVSDLESDRQYSIDAFAINQKDFISNVIVIKAPDARIDVERQFDNKYSSMNIGVVKKVTKINSSDGETVDRIYLSGLLGDYAKYKAIDTYYDCKYSNMTYPLKDKDGISDLLIGGKRIKLEVGDAIGFLLDKNNKIINLRLVFKESTHMEQKTVVNTATDYGNKNRLIYGSLNTISGNLFKINISSEEGAAPYDQIFNNVGVKSKVFVKKDAQGNLSITTGTITDIPYGSGDASEKYGVLIYTIYYAVQMVVVYEL